MADLENSMNGFLNKYNPERSTEEAVSRSIRAAVQHNLLYKPETSVQIRRYIRKYWGDYLIRIGERYQSSMDVKSYEKDIETLKEEINNKFCENLCVEGFRISHSQKSISVFLKHLWCMGHASTPPQCPIDGIILRTAERVLRAENKKHPETDNRWGYVNTIEEHRVKVAQLDAARRISAPNDSLAVWELLQFEVA